MHVSPLAGGPGSTVPGMAAFWLITIIWITSEVWIQLTHQLPPGVDRRDRGSWLFLAFSVWVGILWGWAIAYAAPGAVVSSGREAVFMIGLLFMAAGVALRWYAVTVLGAAFTVAVATRPEQEVIDSGPYRWVRHPSYTGALLTILGFLICLTNWLALIGLVGPAIGYVYRIRIEEQALVEGLGDPYRSYMRRTKRLIPFLF